MHRAGSRSASPAGSKNAARSSAESAATQANWLTSTIGGFKAISHGGTAVSPPNLPNTLRNSFDRATAEMLYLTILHRNKNAQTCGRECRGKNFIPGVETLSGLGFAQPFSRKPCERIWSVRVRMDLPGLSATVPRG